MIKAISIRVTGRVQNVFYRQSTKQQAVKRGIRGFVRNEPDGSVYIEVEGEEKQLKQLVEWCKKGPPASKVESVEIHEVLCKNFSSFEVRY